MEELEWKILIPEHSVAWRKSESQSLFTFDKNESQLQCKLKQIWVLVLKKKKKHYVFIFLSVVVKSGARDLPENNTFRAVFGGWGVGEETGSYLRKIFLQPSITELNLVKWKKHQGYQN